MEPSNPLADAFSYQSERYPLLCAVEECSSDGWLVENFDLRMPPPSP